MPTQVNFHQATGRLIVDDGKTHREIEPGQIAAHMRDPLFAALVPATVQAAIAAYSAPAA